MHCASAREACSTCARGHGEWTLGPANTGVRLVLGSATVASRRQADKRMQQLHIRRMFHRREATLSRLRQRQSRTEPVGHPLAVPSLGASVRSGGSIDASAGPPSHLHQRADLRASAADETFQTEKSAGTLLPAESSVGLALYRKSGSRQATLSGGVLTPSTAGSVRLRRERSSCTASHSCSCESESACLLLTARCS